MTTQVDIPSQNEMLWSTLQAIAQLGGSASIGEIAETVVKIEGFSDAQQEVLHNDGSLTEIGYRLGWARTYLRGMGLLATRDGVAPIDLIDGDQLCDLLKQYELGVHTVTRTVGDTTVDGAFFGDI